MSKKKKYILIGIGVIILIGLLSTIGGNDKSEEQQEQKELILKAAQTEIKGDLKGCYEVVDKDYKVKFAQKSYENDVITVELKRTNKELPYDRDNVVIFPEADESSADYCAGFGIEILNIDGDIIDKINAKANPYSWDEMTAALHILPDETTTIGFHFDNLSEAASFRVTSIIQKNEEKKTNEKATATKETKSMIDDLDDDIDEDLKEAEEALKMAEDAFELAGEMLDVMKNF